MGGSQTMKKRNEKNRTRRPRRWKEIGRIQQFLRQIIDVLYYSSCNSDKVLKGAVVNVTFNFMNGGSLEITPSVF